VLVGGIPIYLVAAHEFRGLPGTGKSFLLLAIIEALRIQHPLLGSVAITATTGMTIFLPKTP
jgi:hypothetical protein